MFPLWNRFSLRCCGLENICEQNFRNSLRDEFGCSSIPEKLLSDENLQELFVKPQEDQDHNHSISECAVIDYLYSQHLILQRGILLKNECGLIILLSEPCWLFDPLVSALSHENSDLHLNDPLHYGYQAVSSVVFRTLWYSSSHLSCWRNPISRGQFQDDMLS